MSRSQSEASILDLPEPTPGVRITYGPDPNQFGELRIPGGSGPYPVVIFLHGGFWRAAYDLTHTSHICAALTGAGFATWNLEYRRIGQPGGGWPGTMDDVLHGSVLLRSLTAHHALDLDRVIVAGHSAGGQLALWLASQRALNLCGVVALAAVSDLRRAWALQLSGGAAAEFLGGTPYQVPARYSASSPQELLPLSVPQRMLHGTADPVVPFGMSERFAHASDNANLIALPDAGHFELIDPRSHEWPAVQKNITQWDFTSQGG